MQGYGLIQALNMTPEQEQFVEESKAFVRENRTRLSKELTDISRYPKEEQPVSVFMAGSPGAGKTETSKAYLEQFRETDALGGPSFEVLIKPIDNGRHVHHADVKRLDAVVQRRFNLEDIYLLCDQELP